MIPRLSFSHCSTPSMHPYRENMATKKRRMNLNMSELKIRNISLHAGIIPVTCYTMFHGSFCRKGKDPCSSCPPLLQIPQVLQAIRTWKKCPKFSGGTKTRQLQWKLHRAQTYPLTCSWTGQSAYVVPLTGSSRLQKPLPSTKSLDLLEQEHGYSVLLLFLRISLSSHSFAPVQPQQPI